MSRSLPKLRFILIVLGLAIICLANNVKNKEQQEHESFTGKRNSKPVNESKPLTVSNQSLSVYGIPYHIHLNIELTATNLFSFNTNQVMSIEKAFSFF